VGEVAESATAAPPMRCRYAIAEQVAPASFFTIRRQLLLLILVIIGQMIIAITAIDTIAIYTTDITAI